MNIRHARGIAAFAFAAAGASVIAEPLGEVDKTARQWIDLRVRTSQLEEAWRTEKDLLESTISALTERATRLEEQRDLAKAKSAKEREELEALDARIKDAAADLSGSDARLKALTVRLLALRPNLPPRLSAALDLPYRSLATPELPFGERMQYAMTILNRCAQFNRVVTAGEDVLALEEGSPAKSLDTIYWGLSHGYAVDRPGHKAWIGAPGSGGWRWESQPEAYDAIVRLLEVARDATDPEFVVVPGRVANEFNSATGGAPQ